MIIVIIINKFKGVCKCVSKSRFFKEKKTDTLSLHCLFLNNRKFLKKKLPKNAHETNLILCNYMVINSNLKNFLKKVYYLHINLL